MDKESMILDNVGLIYSIIKRYEMYYDKEDLYQVGVMGLLKASSKFDPSYGVKFSTFAYKYIKGEVRKFIREDRSIRVSKEVYHLQQSVEKLKDQLRQTLLREPTIQEIASILEVDEDTILEADRALDYVSSLDYVMSDEGKELSLYDSVKQEETRYDPDIMELTHQIDRLEPREKQLIIARYFEDLTQQETAKLLGIHQVQVSRTESKIFQKIKNNMSA